MTTPEIPDYIGIAEVARRLGIDPKTVRKGIRLGTIQGGVQITPHCYRVLRGPFEAWLNPKPQPAAEPVQLLHTRKAS